MNGLYCIIYKGELPRNRDINVKLCVCLCLRGKVLNSRSIFDNFLTFKLNCFSVFSLIMDRKKDKFKHGVG